MASGVTALQASGVNGEGLTVHGEPRIDGQAVKLSLSSPRVLSGDPHNGITVCRTGLKLTGFLHGFQNSIQAPYVNAQIGCHISFGYFYVLFLLQYQQLCKLVLYAV